MRAIEYGIPTDKEAIQLRLGIAKGFFRDEGLDLSLQDHFRRTGNRRRLRLGCAQDRRARFAARPRPR